MLVLFFSYRTLVFNPSSRAKVVANWCWFGKVSRAFADMACYHKTIWFHELDMFHEHCCFTMWDFVDSVVLPFFFSCNFMFTSRFNLFLLIVHHQRSTWIFLWHMLHAITLHQRVQSLTLFYPRAMLTSWAGDHLPSPHARLRLSW